MLVTNDAAVLNASAGSTPGNPSDQGSSDWNLCSAYRPTTLTKEKAITDAAYTDQRWSARGSTPTTR